MLFGKNGVGIDKIKLVSYNTTEISKLTNAQIQNVINQVKKYTSEYQSHVTLKTEVSVKQDNDMISEESLDENQIVEQDLIHELCSFISPEDNVSSTEIISSCVSLENLISGSAQHLSYLFEIAIKSSQQEILNWYNYSFEFESKVDALMADGRIKDKTARSMIYKEMKPFLPTKIT